MIEAYFRPFYQKILGNPIALFLGKFLSPNGITLLSVLTGIGIIPALFYDQGALALCLLVLSGLFDTLDGTVARLYQSSTSLGTVADIVGDRIVEFSILLSFFLVAPESHSLSCFIMLGSVLICVTSFLVVGIFSENTSHKSFHYSPGLIERPEAFVFFGAMMLVPNFFNFLAALFSFLVFLTAFLRLLEFKRSFSVLRNPPC
ncbi:MAG: CDP-alcohol phosphatidyltransferase family protein [Alphaproteobacteria bacterium]|nr:CDP-alcohol phosphatidyltransferase family protein [Alphaproteobacteria bacterium]